MRYDETERGELKCGKWRRMGRRGRRERDEEWRGWGCEIKWTGDRNGTWRRRGGTKNGVWERMEMEGWGEMRSEMREGN